MTYSTLSKQYTIKRLYTYIIITLSCGIFSVVYELFSHQVYSNFMIYVFTVPLLLGVLPQLIFLAKPQLAARNAMQRLIHRFAIATLAVGSILQGVVEIYGTTNQYIIYYFIVGSGLLLLSGSLYLKQLIKHN